MTLRDARIVVDGYQLRLAQGTGASTYARAVIRALQELGAHVGVLLDCRHHKDPFVQEALLFDAAEARSFSKTGLLLRALCALALGCRAARVPRPSRAGPQEGLWPTLGALYTAPSGYLIANQLFRRLGATLRVRVPDPVHVWHTTFPLPVRIRGARTISTILDIIPLALPWATLDDKVAFHKLVKQILSRSDAVATLSEHTKNDLVERFGAGPDRIHVTQVPVEAPQAPPAPQEIERRLRRYGLEPENYILYVGALEPRKNLGRVMQALALLDEDIPLVLAGRSLWWREEDARHSETLQRKGRLLALGYVPRADLAALFAGALCLAWPSLYEGFGLPPLEAMAHDCPVLTSTASSLPEVCGDAALYVDPYDVDDIAEKMQALIRDAALRQGLRRKGRERVALFSMERFTARIAKLYEDVLS
jgi:glycosyltransferase involved in cell wall biosynthesis